MPVSLGAWPRFQYFNQLEGKQERRNRAVQSCTECRRRKSKCDRKFPCGPCKLRNEAHLCVEHQRVQSEGLTGYTHLQDFDLLAARCKDLEMMLLTLINDNGGTLNLSRVQPDLDGGDDKWDASMDDPQDQTYHKDEIIVEKKDMPCETMDGQEKRTGVRFEQTLVHASGSRSDGAWQGSTEIQVHSGTRPTPTEARRINEGPGTVAAQLSSNTVNVYTPHRLWNSPPDDPHTQSRPTSRRSESNDFTFSSTRDMKLTSRPSSSSSKIGSHANDSRAPSHAPSLTDHDAALALEDMALNRNLSRDTGGGGVDSGGAGRTWQGADGLPENVSMGPVMVMPGTQPSWARRVHVAGLEVLPPVGQAQPIINYFMGELEWLFRVFHIPTFFQRLSIFHNQLPLVNPLTNDATAFVALYAAIICTSLHLMDEHALANVGIAVNARTGYLQELSDLVELALVRCDWGGVPRIETLQAFIVIGPYWSSCGRLEAHLGLLGTAVKVAHNLGVNRLGPELATDATYHQVSNHFGRKWVMANDREVGRRIWWTLVELDWNAAPDHQFNHITSRNLSTSAEPAHVNDESLLGHGPIIPESLDVHTGMSFFVNRLRFLYPFQRFVESAIDDGRLRYEVAVETQTDFIHTIEHLSPFYRLNADFAMDLEKYASDARQLARMAAEKRVINMSGHLRVLRCHRFYLPEAYHIPKYNYSKEAVLKSSRWLLSNNPTRDPVPGIPLRFWPVSYSLLVATIVSMLHLCHVEAEDVADAALLVRRGIDALRVDQGSPALRASADAIQQLYDIEMSERQRKRHAQPPPMGDSWRKRKREDDGQDMNKFQRLVKKAFGSPVVVQEPGQRPESLRYTETPSAIMTGSSRSTGFDFVVPLPDHAAPFPTHGYPTGMPPSIHNPTYGQQHQFLPMGPMPQGTTFLGDPSMFMADENLMELMKWGASSMGPDAFGTGLWPFPGDTPSSHSGNKQF